MKIFTLLKKSLVRFCEMFPELLSTECFKRNFVPVFENFDAFNKIEITSCSY